MPGEQQKLRELKLPGVAGKAAGTWKLMRPDKLGQTRPCGHISMRCAWLPGAQVAPSWELLFQLMCYPVPQVRIRS